jgi:hypothetical protein
MGRRIVSIINGRLNNMPEEEKADKTAISTKENEEKDVEVPKYSDEEKIYLRNLQKKLTNAKNRRDEARVEYDNQGIISYHQANEQYANTELKAKENKGETLFQSGTLRTKMMGFVSTFQSMNLTAEISAYNDYQLALPNLAKSIEDVIWKNEEMDNDEEKKMLRQYEMLKDGAIYVESVWEDRTEISRTVASGECGQIQGVKIDSKEIKGIGRITRRILPYLSVYEGSVRKYFIEDQPFVFTAEIWDYDEAEKVYGNWERWKFVSKKKRSFNSAVDPMANNNWRLTETADNEVERIIYQDKLNNEIQVILNGVLMLPMGYPLTKFSPDGEYTITQQNLEPINHEFSRGKSFIFKNKNILAILDELMKLAVLKTQQSFLPPSINVSGRVITNRVFMPGVITRGIEPNSLQPIMEGIGKGVTNSEFAMIQEVMRFVDQNTASQTFMGAAEQGGKPTATQITALQKQAFIMLGILLLSASLLEKKLNQRAIVLAIAHWFDPIDEEFNEARNAIINKYQSVSRPTMVDNKQGLRMTVPSEIQYSAEEIKEEEDRLEKEFGTPIRITTIDPQLLKKTKITWYVTVTEKPKKTSAVNKMVFMEMAQTLNVMGQQLSPEFVQRKVAEMYDEDPSRMFAPVQPPPPQEQPEASGKVASARVTVPTTQVEGQI